jgi:hypothetical protein
VSRAGKPQSPTQRAAALRNWSRFRLLGIAASILGLRPPVGSAEDDADLLVAQEALRRIHDRHQARNLRRWGAA